MSAKKVDNRPIMDRGEFERRVKESFPEAAVERHDSGELVIYTGWTQDEAGDVTLLWGEKP